MNESLRELVSRYVDGDLDDAESSRLETRAETDAEVAAEIDTTRDLKAALGSIADRMEPPAALDGVMEPLRLAPPAPAQRARPVFRWLGIAAAVVLGVTVATEMARRNPTPTLNGTAPQRNRPVGEREDIFKLAPLPTAVPGDSRPLGAIDHLLEEDPTSPSAPEPAPLEVMGPLNTPAPTTATTESISASDMESAEEDREFASGLTQTVRQGPAKIAPDSRADDSKRLATEPESKRQKMPIDDHQKSRAATSTVGTLRQNPATGGSARAVVSARLLVDGVAVWTGSSSSCKNGRWPVRIEVQGNVVSAITPVIVGGKNTDGDSCTPDAFIGSHLEGIGNGMHQGELIIGETPK